MKKRADSGRSRHHLWFKRSWLEYFTYNSELVSFWKNGRAGDEAWGGHIKSSRWMVKQWRSGVSSCCIRKEAKSEYLWLCMDVGLSLLTNMALLNMCYSLIPLSCWTIDWIIMYVEYTVVSDLTFQYFFQISQVSLWRPSHLHCLVCLCFILWPCVL